MNKISINVEEIAFFPNFENWVNTASTKLTGHSRLKDTICVDMEGNSLLVGADFMAARDKGTFPVRAYKLIRVSEYGK